MPKIKKTDMSPLEVEILLHYYYSPNDFPNLDAPAVKSAIIGFIELGVLRQKDANVKSINYEAVREALSVYVDAVCAVPLPKQKWIIENV